MTFALVIAIGAPAAMGFGAFATGAGVELPLLCFVCGVLGAALAALAGRSACANVRAVASARPPSHVAARGAYLDDAPRTALSELVSTLYGPLRSLRAAAEGLHAGDETAQGDHLRMILAATATMTALSEQLCGISGTFPGSGIGEHLPGVSASTRGASDQVTHNGTRTAAARRAFLITPPTLLRTSS